MASPKLLNGHPFIPYVPEVFEPDEIITRSDNFYNTMKLRRSCRDFSDKNIPSLVIENILLTASSAPSGANKQPWTFCVVSDPVIKKVIRNAAEKEEEDSYKGRMDREWLNDLAPLGTDWHKPYLETAPYLIVVFRRTYEIDEHGQKHQNYYVHESCGIACGFLLAAIHQAGLAALTHLPSPMNFLSRILDRPDNEKPFMMIPVGYPADECWVPDITKKQLEDIAVWY
jgi:iodotyrosine deiodinase